MAHQEPQLDSCLAIRKPNKTPSGKELTYEAKGVSRVKRTFIPFSLCLLTNACGNLMCTATHWLRLQGHAICRFAPDLNEGRRLGDLLYEKVTLACSMYTQGVIQVQEIEVGLRRRLPGENSQNPKTRSPKRPGLRESPPGLVKNDKTRVRNGPGTGSVSVNRRPPSGMPKKLFTRARINP